MPFVLNTWYAAAWSGAVGRSLLARRILGEPLVLYRTAAGEPVALLDRCPHRLLPLSKGTLLEDAIECGYHGLTFDGSGRCVRVPGQERIPANARVRSYPAVDHFGMVWVWPGDPAAADRSQLFGKIPWGAAGWGLNTGPYTHVKADYRLLVENLLDPAHVTYVHKSTLGTAAMADIPSTTTELEDAILVTRWTHNARAAPILQRFGRWPGNVDRWQYYYWYPPSISVTDFGAHEPGAGESEPARQAGVRMYSCHFLTPETETSTHYHWLQLRNFAQEDLSVSREITEQFIVAFNEDKSVLEAIQEAERDPQVTTRVKLALDAGSARMRRRLEQLIAAERTSLHAAHE